MSPIFFLRSPSSFCRDRQIRLTGTHALPLHVVSWSVWFVFVSHLHAAVFFLLCVSRLVNSLFEHLPSSNHESSHLPLRNIALIPDLYGQSF